MASISLDPRLPQFVVAKYVPDLIRMEPKNIGVILWHAGSIAARFLGENPETPNKVSLPKSLFDKNGKYAYLQWLKYWRHQLSKPSIRTQDGKNLVAKDSPEFLSELTNSSKPQFLLVSGGCLMEKIAPIEIQDAVDDLYGKIVEVDGKSENADSDDQKMKQNRIALTRGINKAIAASQIRERLGYFPHYTWMCPIEGAREKLTFRFDHAIHRGKPLSLLQHVLIYRPETVNNAVFMFQNMIKYQNVERERCASLVYSSPQDLQNDQVRTALAAIRSCSRVIDVSDLDNATRVISDIAT